MPFSAFVPMVVDLARIVLVRRRQTDDHQLPDVPPPPPPHQPHAENPVAPCSLLFWNDSNYHHGMAKQMSRQTRKEILELLLGDDDQEDDDQEQLDEDDQEQLDDDDDDAGQEAPDDDTVGIRGHTHPREAPGSTA